VKKATLEITEKFLKEGPTQEELERAKRMIAASATFARDSQMGMANWYGSMLITGETVDQIQGWEGRIRAVTADQVLKAMNKYMNGPNHIDATLLPEAK